LSEKIDRKELEIKPLDSSMNRAAFYCGKPELDNFFRDSAIDHHERYLTQVYVALYENEIVGYYWLNAQSHSSKIISEEALKTLERIPFAPCIYLGMIATLGAVWCRIPPIILPLPTTSFVAAIGYSGRNIRGPGPIRCIGTRPSGEAAGGCISRMPPSYCQRCSSENRP